MGRQDCISNRNIKIVATYVSSKLGTYLPLFEGIPYPADEYHSPEDFFLNEDEWTTLENFNRIFRKARGLVDEPYFYFNCGASSIKLRSWGRFHYFVRLFATPNDGFRRLPFFNKNSNDTKEIDVIMPPAYDSKAKKVKTLLKIEIHSDIDPNRDYMRDPYFRGIVSHIPTIWELPPAFIKQPLNPYNPEVLFNEEPEFIPYGLDAKIEANLLSINDPARGQRRIVGEKVLLEPDIVNGREVFLGRYTKKTNAHSRY
ncbi:hypothetical protein KA005_19185, partial [bacterium]|nr:hypothetical protein [bacterium]